MKGIALAAALLAVLTLVFSVTDLKASEGLSLDQSELIIGAPEKDCGIYEGKEVNVAEGCDVGIKDAVSSDENVAVPHLLTVNTFMYVNPVGMGSCVITVTGEDGSTFEIAVTVNEEWGRAALKDVSHIISDTCCYGSKRIEMISKPGASYTLKVGTKTYEGVFDSNGDAAVKLDV